jgi:nucleoside-diphosphate-sugar epimerase
MAAAGVWRLVFSSSATVYGDPATVPIREDMPTGPTNPYGRTKWMVEHLLGDLAAADPRWQIGVLRYFNPVGAHDSGRIGEDPQGMPNNLMPFVAQVAVGKRPSVQVFGNDYDTPDGTGVRDYIHVVDLALGHLRALERLATHAECRAINLGTGTGYSVLEMIEAFAKASGRPVPHQVVARRAGDVASCYADPRSALELLGKWMRTDVSKASLNADLAPKANLPEGDFSVRPEMRLFSVQLQQLSAGKDALSLKKQPKVELFAQGGIGRPNPFNFFETGLNPFGMVGLRAHWTPFDWGNTKRDIRILDLQAQNVGIQQEAFRQRYEAGYLKERRDNDKWLSQLSQDDAIIALQEDIVKRADAQVKNGVMTATDYLTQINLLTQARLTKKMHEIQAAQARELWVAKTGADQNK